MATRRQKWWVTLYSILLLAVAGLGYLLADPKLLDSIIFKLDVDESDLDNATRLDIRPGEMIDDLSEVQLPPKGEEIKQQPSASDSSSNGEGALFEEPPIEESEETSQ